MNNQLTLKMTGYIQCIVILQKSVLEWLEALNFYQCFA